MDKLPVITGVGIELSGELLEYELTPNFTLLGEMPKHNIIATTTRNHMME